MNCQFGDNYPNESKYGFFYILGSTLIMYFLKTIQETLKVKGIKEGKEMRQARKCVKT
jgi:hypothetical protein